MGKGRKLRTCPLWPETVKLVKRYITERSPKEPEEQSLFLNARGMPITRFGIGYILTKHTDAAKEQCVSLQRKKVTPHTIRHTTAMHMLRAGNDVHMVSYWLGHADLNTTHVYVEIDMEMKRKMIEKVDVPKQRKRPAWQKPHILQWLDELTKDPELCGVKPCRIARNPK
jgi:integrase/recombinase XerD